MKKLFLFFILFSLLNLTSCEKMENPSTNSEKKVSDAKIEADVNRTLDSIDNAVKNEMFEDAQKPATNDKTTPVEVVNSRLVKMEYSNHKNIELKYKNISNKTIQAIKFEWFGKNAFGEPADMGNPISSGQGGGFTDETLKPGKAKYGTWEIFSADAKTITTVRATEVVFNDGTKWTIK